MRRFVAILLALVLIFSMIGLSGCSGRECEVCGFSENLRTIREDGESYTVCRDCYMRHW